MASSSFLYVANSQSRTVSAFRMDRADGSLEPIHSVAVPGPSTKVSLPIAIDRTNGNLLVSIRCEPWMVCTYNVDTRSGRLTYTGHGPLADNMCFMACDMSGQYLFSASYFGNKIAVNRFGENGIPLPPHQVIETQPKSHCIIPSPDNRYVLSTALGGDLIYSWKFDSAAGILAANRVPSVAVKKGSGPRHIVFHPTGKFVYLLNELTNTVQTFAYRHSSGVLEELHSIDATKAGAENAEGRIFSSAIRVSHDGRLLFSAERGTSILAAFRIDDQTGIPSLTSHAKTESIPWCFALSPDSRFLYALGFSSEKMICYSVNPDDGSLSKIDEYRIGYGASWVEVWN